MHRDNSENPLESTFLPQYSEFGNEQHSLRIQFHEDEQVESNSLSGWLNKRSGREDERRRIDPRNPRLAPELTAKPEKKKE